MHDSAIHEPLAQFMKSLISINAKGNSLNIKKEPRRKGELRQGSFIIQTVSLKI